MSIMEYNGGSVVAMKGKNCVAIGKQSSFEVAVSDTEKDRDADR
jgi:20S proteasome alpha/beta subunit